MTREEIRNSVEVAEKALLRVRIRHEKAGDAHKYTFGELLKEAHKELEEEMAEFDRTGRNKYDDIFDSLDAKSK